MLSSRSAAASSHQPAGTLAAFDAGLARLGEDSGKARSLLTALAWGRDPGLTRGIWVTVAHALSAGGGTDQPAVSDADVGRLLRKGRSWVVTQAPPGRPPVYRLRDATLAGQLRDASTLAAAARGECPVPAVERRITDALLATVPTGPSGRNWLSADPYLRAHLTQHVAAAGGDALAALVADAGFLAVADPAGLMPLLGGLALTARETFRSYRLARPMLGGDPHANAAYLEESAYALGITPTAANTAAQIRPLFRTVLARMRHDDSLVTLTGHSGEINRVLLGTSPDGRVLVATGSDDKTVRVWDSLTGEPACPPITAHTDEVWCVAFGHAPDGRLLLASCGKDKTIRIWDSQTGTPVIDPITGHTERVYYVEFATVKGEGEAGGGRLLLASGSGDNTARIWDPLTGAPIGGPLTGHAGRVRSLGFGTCPDGRLLLATSSPGDAVLVWDPLTGETVTPPITGHPGTVYGVDFCEGPRGELLLFIKGADGVVSFWDPLTGESAGTPFSMLTGPVYPLRFGTGDDGQQYLAYAGGRTHVQVCDPCDASREPVTLVSLGGKVRNMAFCQVKGDGEAGGGKLLLATASGDLSVRVWDRFSARAGEGAAATDPGRVRSLAFANGPGGEMLLATASGGNELDVWEPRTATMSGKPLTGRPDWVDCAAFTVASDGHVLLASAGRDGTSDTTVQVWEPLAGTLVTGPLTLHGETVRSLAFGVGPDGRLLLASASDSGAVQVWDALTGKPAGNPIAAHQKGADTVAFGTLPGGRVLLASGGGDATVRLWDPTTGKPAGAALRGHGGRVRCVAFGTDAGGHVLLASASDDRSARIWRPLAARPARKTLTGHTDAVSCLAFATGPGGQMLLATGGDDRTVRVWEPVKGSCLATIARWSSVHALAVAGLTLAAGHDEGFSVVELDPGTLSGATPS